MSSAEADPSPVPPAGAAGATPVTQVTPTVRVGGAGSIPAADPGAASEAPCSAVNPGGLMSAESGNSAGGSSSGSGEALAEAGGLAAASSGFGDALAEAGGLAGAEFSKTAVTGTAASSAAAAAAAATSEPPAIMDTGAAAAAVTALRTTHKHDPDASRTACSTIANLAAAAGVPEALGREHAGAALAETLRRHKANPDTCKSACDAVSALAQLPENRPKLLRDGVAPALLGVFEAQLESAAVCEAACRAVAELGGDSGVKAILAQLGALARVTAALRRHEVEPAAAAAACAAIARLATSTGSSDISPGIDGTTLAAVLATLQRHIHCASVAAPACEAVASLMKVHPMATAARPEAIGALLAALDGHEDRPCVVKPAFDALGCMATSRAGAEQLASAGIAARIGILVSAHPSDAGVAVAALSVAARLAAQLGAEHQLRLFGDGVAGTALSSLERHAGDAAVAQAACKLLGHLAAEKRVAVLLHPAAASAVISAFERHNEFASEEDAAGRAGSAAVSALCQFLRAAVTDPSALPVGGEALDRLARIATVAMSSHCSDSGVDGGEPKFLRSVAELVSVMTQLGPRRIEAAEALLRAGTVPALVACLQAQLVHGDITKSAVNSLRYLCDSPERRAALAGSGAIEAVCAALHRHVSHALHEPTASICCFLGNLAGDDVHAAALDSARVVELALMVLTDALKAMLEPGTIYSRPARACVEMMQRATGACRLLHLLHTKCPSKLPAVGGMGCIMELLRCIFRVSPRHHSHSEGACRCSDWLAPGAEAACSALSAMCTSFVRRDTHLRMVHESDRRVRGLELRDIATILAVLDQQNASGRVCTSICTVLASLPKTAYADVREKAVEELARGCSRAEAAARVSDVLLRSRIKAALGTRTEGLLRAVLLRHAGDAAAAAAAQAALTMYQTLV